MPKQEFADFLDTPAEAVATSKVKVPNVFPSITTVPYRLAIIGEAPGTDEIEQGKPFVGYSGQLLDKFLSRFSILRDACFVGNICQYQPAGNKIATFDWNGPEIQSGLKQLASDLQSYRPNICLLFGGSALHAFAAPHIVPSKRKNKDGQVFVFPNSIGDWRGSKFLAHVQAPLAGVKCISSYHPVACLRQFEWTPMLMMDLQRAMSEATKPTLALPSRNLLVTLRFEEIISELDKIIATKPIIGTDIEGYWNNWKCISIAPSPDYSFIVPFTKMDGSSLWSFDEEVLLMKKVSQIMADPKIVKVWQNGLYDRFCMQYGYNIVTRGPSDDIMLKHWELYCELEKALGVQASIYTEEPYYKAEIKANDRETFWRYCCKDSAITLEINRKLDRFLQPTSRQHYDFNRTLLNSLLYMELRGIRYDITQAKARLERVNQQIYELQYDLNVCSGFGLKCTDKATLRAMVRDTMCYKRDQSMPKKEYTEAYKWAMQVLNEGKELTKAEYGRLSIELDLHLNIKSPALKKFLYETLSLPIQKDPLTHAVTTDYEALLKLSKLSDHPSLRLCIDLGELRTRSQMLHIETDSDGRIRSSYNEVGSETGRVTSLTSPTGSGYNLQTVPDENDLKPEGHPLREGMRDLLLADEGCYLAKCDLKGADGWTIGANLAALGDRTMLDDLLFGLKPASISCYGFRHGPQSVMGRTRQQLAELCQEVKKHDWDYFANKQCVWGFCYLMGVRKAAQHVFNVSEGTVQVTESQMQLVKDVVFRRYNVALWHRAMERKLFNQPYPPKLISPSGHIRMFFGRKTDIVGQALAHEPQSVTTYATNSAVFKCWTDPENRYRDRDGRIRLRVEPMHQVHDEFLCQFRREDTDWAKAKIKQWFSTPIRIAGVEVVIPYDGVYGTNWAMDSKSKIGSI